MRHRAFAFLVAGSVLAGLLVARPALGQYREYYILGKVVDPQKQPLEGVEITLRDQETSRSYSLKTKKDGTFKFAGLPHGVYKVAFKKDGFAVKEDEWKFTEPQLNIEKVEIPPVVLASEELVRETNRLKETEAAVKAAAEKIRQGDFDGAISGLKPVLEKNPKDSNALYLIGLAYLKKNMFPEASAAFVQVTELAPKFAPAYYQLGVCYQQQKELEKALESYRKAMELDPANPDSPFYSGIILFGMSRIDEALALIEKTLSLKPDDPAALEMAGRCYAHQANFPKAVEYLEKAKAGFATDQEHVKFLDGLITKLKEQIKK
ncbi:MAG: tetratricopeptide repeat protein [Candidatus Aminicenantales bacterium]|jgi:tetratricopeptide (TPR) repeat protein